MSDNEEFKLGDIVFSKLSKKPMIVEEINDDDITCVRAIKDTIKQERDTFKVHTLRKPNKLELFALKKLYKLLD